MRLARRMWKRGEVVRRRGHDYLFFPPLNGRDSTWWADVYIRFPVGVWGLLGLFHNQNSAGVWERVWSDCSSSSVSGGWGPGLVAMERKNPFVLIAKKFFCNKNTGCK